jgi:type I restriction enzyme S subunit
MRNARLGDVVVSMKNGLYKPASEYADDGTPCLRMYNIDSGSIVWRDIKRMRVSAAELDEYGLREGDLLVNRVNSRELVGKAALIPPSLEASVFESKNIRVRLDASKAIPKFINYQLLAGSRRHFADNAQQVVGMASISQKQLADFPIVLTDLDEQRRIVAEIEKQFSRLDEAVANLKRYNASVLKTAVEGHLVPTDASNSRERQRAFISGAEFLAAVLQKRRELWAGRGKYKEPTSATQGVDAQVPEGWVVATLNQLTLQIADVDHKMPRAVDRGVAYVSTKDFTGDDTIDLNGAKQISPDDYQALSRKVRPVRGDLLLSRYGTVGEVRGVETDVPFQASYSVAIIKPVRGFNLADYLKIALRSDAVQAQIKRDVRATAQPDLGLAHIREFVVPLPPASEQRRIVAEVDRRLSIVREVEAEADANLKRAQALRQAVLGRAFSTEQRRAIHSAGRSARGAARKEGELTDAPCASIDRELQGSQRSSV